MASHARINPVDLWLVYKKVIFIDSLFIESPVLILKPSHVRPRTVYLWIIYKYDQFYYYTDS